VVGGNVVGGYTDGQLRMWDCEQAMAQEAAEASGAQVCACHTLQYVCTSMHTHTRMHTQ